MAKSTCPSTAKACLLYDVLYKHDLTDTNWNYLATTLAPMAWQTNINSIGVYTNVVFSDNITTNRQFYRLQVK